MKDKDFEIISNGIVYCSVCTSLTDRAAIEAETNWQNPTGTRSRWEIVDETFASGQPNPCPCETHAGRQHYLLGC